MYSDTFIIPISCIKHAFKVIFNKMCFVPYHDIVNILVVKYSAYCFTVHVCLLQGIVVTTVLFSEC